MAGVTGYRYTFAKPTNESNNYGHISPQAPLFERNQRGEEFEIQHCRQIIDALQARIQDLERINVDLEYRLEDQARQCMSAEKECMQIKREWTTKCESLQNEINHWKDQYAAEQAKSTRLREQNSRTERELYRILQRKYELMRGINAQTSQRGSNSNSLHDIEKELMTEEKPQVYYCCINPLLH